jgi:hypothetical protein
METIKTENLDKWEKKLVSILNYEKKFKAGKLFFKSKWEYGVFLYKLDLAYNLFNNIPYFKTHEKENYPESVFSNRETLKKHVLNGAKNFKHYSEGGCSLVFWEDIASRLCTDYERKKYPNKIYENAVSELQPRALLQAFNNLSEELFND